MLNLKIHKTEGVIPMLSGETATTKKMYAVIIVLVFSLTPVKAQVTCNGNKICVKKCTNWLLNVCSQYQYKCINPNQLCNQELNGWRVCSGNSCHSGGQQGGRIEGKTGNETATSLSVYPNPAASESVLSFYNESVQKVTLNIFDMSGRHVKTLAEREFDEGIIEMGWSTEGINAGIYFLRMEAGGKSLAQKISVIQ